MTYTATLDLHEQTSLISSAFAGGFLQRREVGSGLNFYTAINESLTLLHDKANWSGAIDAGAELAYINLFLSTHRQFMKAIKESEDEIFFDGMDSALSGRIHVIVKTNGEVAVSALEQALRLKTTKIECAEEIIRQLGLIEDAKTRHARMSLIEEMLMSPEERIRDAAALGLAFLDDPAALPNLYRARDTETSAWLRKNLDQVVCQLEQTGCHNT